MIGSPFARGDSCGCSGKEQGATSLGETPRPSLFLEDERPSPSCDCDSGMSLRQIVIVLLIAAFSWWQYTKL